MIARVLGNALNDLNLRALRHTRFLEGQRMNRGTNTLLIMLIQERKTLLTVGCEDPNKSASMYCAVPCRNLIIVIRNSSHRFSFLRSGLFSFS